MSFRNENKMSLAGIDTTSLTKENLSSIFNTLLNNGMHGICFSPYTENQSPGSILSTEQILHRIEVIKPFTTWVRTFSSTEGNEKIPAVAKQNGLKTFVGAWLGSDKDKNAEEIKNVIQIAKEGHADIVAVGNEVLYRGDLSETELLEYISHVKRELPNIPVGYVDAYYEFYNRPAITDACDIIFANCYPFWEGCHINYSLLYMKDMYHRAQNAAKGKKVIISETGWPSQGTAFGESEPSFENAIRYFINTQKWSSDEGIDIFYFSSFDELWKVSDEGDVGAYWGLWDKNEKLKFL